MTLSTFLEGKRKWLWVACGEARHFEHVLENTVWISSGEKQEYGEKQERFWLYCGEKSESQHICRKKKKVWIVEEDEWPRHSLKKVNFFIIL